MADGIYFNERTKTYDIPISHLDFKYLNSCSDVDELEKIMKTLRSGEVGRYVELESCCEERIKLLNPRSRVLRKTIEPIKITQLDKEERCQVEQDFQSWLDEMKSLNEEYNAEESDENGYHHLSAKTKKKINSEIEADINDEALEEKFLKYDNEDLPPVRRTVVFHDEPAIRVYSSGDNTFGRRVLKPRDYSEWDKLEKVWDKELEEENQTICKPERGEIMNLSEVETRGLTKLDYKELASRVANIPIQTRQKLAEREKDKGMKKFEFQVTSNGRIDLNLSSDPIQTHSFKSGDYADALNYYKRSLIIYETTTVYNNRAIVYLRQKQWNHAVNDCTKVLKVEPDNLKALFRRGQANFELHNLEQAEKDLERLTDQDPTNFKAQNLLRNVRIAKSKREKPHLEGSRRMVITDVGDSSDSSSSEDDEVEQKGEHDDEQKHQSAKLSEIKLPIDESVVQIIMGLMTKQQSV
ncbi:unnamed protein product [Heterobilharzia americana]|nr:unnamed protein product [Heterobilharzia americana]